MSTATTWGTLPGSTSGSSPSIALRTAASLTPFTFLPTILLPLPWVYTGIIFLKLNVAFWFAYLWLREEHLGKRGAAIGAILFAAAGPIAVRWWWHVTNAAPLYPALLWIALRTARGKRTPAWAIGLIALFYALSAFPATMAYGAYAAAAYFIYLAIRERRFAPRVLATTAFATILGIVIAAPSFIPLAQLVGRSGYLESRASAAAEHVFPLRHFALFVNPDHLGNIALRPVPRDDRTRRPGAAVPIRPSPGSGWRCFRSCWRRCSECR